MKVLMFGWEFPPHISGGLGTASYGLTKALLKTDVEILFVVPKTYGDEKPGSINLLNASDVTVNLEEDIYKDYWDKMSFLEIDAALLPYLNEEEYYNLKDKMDRGIKPGKNGINKSKYEFKGGYGVSLVEEVKRYAMVAASIANNETFDIIHAHDWLTYLSGLEAKRVSGKPLVVHMHATEFDRSGENVNPSVYEIERKGMTEADLVVAVSNMTRSIVINRYGIDPNKVVTVYNGVEQSKLLKNVAGKKNVKEKIVTFLGRITYQKGPEYFIEAANIILKRDSNVRFVMAGSGDLLPKMIRRVAQLNIADKFHFTGFLNSEDVDKMFGMSDIYVMPSVSEPFGISPLEAMRSNVPVIISKQSGVSEVLKNAIKIDFWDINAMADAIYALLNYNSLPEMFKNQGKTEVVNIKWDNTGKKVKELYDSVLNEK